MTELVFGILKCIGAAILFLFLLLTAHMVVVIILDVINDIRENIKFKNTKKAIEKFKRWEFPKSIDAIRELKNNWDGYGAVPPDPKIIDNTVTFHKTISDAFPNLTGCVDVTPTPYGNLVLDYQRDGDLVSIEVCYDRIGFFTVFNKEDNILVDDIVVDFNTIPGVLMIALKKL